MKIEAEHDYAKGSRNGNSKLNESKALAIKNSKGKITQTELTGIYGVNRATISKMHAGTIWKHI